MTSVPSSPRTPRSIQKITQKTPKSAVKRTILDLGNESYMEEFDETYEYNESTSISDEEVESEVESEDEEEIIDEGELKELIADEATENDVVNKHNNSTEVAESADIKSSDDAVVEDNTKISKDEFHVAKVNEAVAAITSVYQKSELRKFIFKHEVPRKLLHSSIGTLTLWLYTRGVHQTQLIVPLVTLFIIIFTNDYVRFKNPELNKKIVKAFWFLIREKEVDSYNGVLWFLIGLIIVFSVLPKDISLMCVLLLSWADTAASTIGRQFGKYTPKISPRKSVAGSTASFLTGVFSCYLIYGYFIPAFSHLNTAEDILWTPESSKLGLHTYAILSGVIASVSEFIDLFEIDDNFTIPVLSGFFLYGLVKATQIV